MHYMTPVQRCLNVSYNAINIWRKDTDKSQKVKVGFLFLKKKVYIIILFRYEIVLVR